MKSHPEGLYARERPWFSEQANSRNALQKKRTSFHQKAETQHVKKKKKKKSINLWAVVLLGDITNVLLTTAPVQTQGCISGVNSPEEHQRSSPRRWTVSPSSSQSSSLLSHEELEGETGSHYCLWLSWFKYHLETCQNSLTMISVSLLVKPLVIERGWLHYAHPYHLWHRWQGSEAWSAVFRAHEEGGRYELSTWNCHFSFRWWWTVVERN